MNELPYILSAATALAAAFVGRAYGRRLHARGFTLSAHISVNECPLIPLSLLLFVLLQVCASTLLRNPQIGWILPLPVEYYITPAMWALKLFFVVFAMASVAAVAVLQAYPRRAAILLFTIAAALAVEGLNRWAVQPGLGQIEERWRDGVIIQTNPSTCAAASAANIARQFGIEKTEAEMVDLLNTTWAGTSPAQIVYGLRSLGLMAEKVQHPDRDLSKVRAPAILLVDAGGEPDAHAVAYMGRRGPLYEIWDPNPGRTILPLAAIQERWRGRAIEVRAE
ncbi:MAG: hypothetical protein KF886_13895 [Candidatus Hydrogenedentes bacterium]|nr:hypothetical protein [Candidatus Hydrogenedentota bacterium]